MQIQSRLMGFYDVFAGQLRKEVSHFLEKLMNTGMMLNRLTSEAVILEGISTKTAYTFDAVENRLILKNMKNII